MSATPNLPITGNHTLVPVLTAGDTTKDGTGSVSLLAQAGTSGAYLYQIRVMAYGTNSTSTILRVWLNNNSTPTVAANNSLLYEIQLPATTISETLAQKPQVYNCNIRLKANYRLYCCLSTTVSAGWQPFAVVEDL